MAFDEKGLMIYNYIQQQTGIYLNEGQRKMVEPSDVPIAASAVPGAGKTNTLTIAVAAKELIEGIPGNRIHVMTFTNKATNEFKHRHEVIMKKIKPNLRSNVNVSTIHSMCKKYVETFQTTLGFRELKALDEVEAKTILKRAIAHITGVRENQVGANLVNDVLGLIGYLNNRMITSEEEIRMTQHFIDLGMDLDKFLEIKTYFTFTQRNNSNLSFDEWMVVFYELLKNNSEIRKAIQDQIKALYVDEFQDTTPLQFEIIKLLKADTTSLTVVGDPDQTVYRWRGATAIFKDFMDTYRNHRLVKMDVNYRCPDYVIEAGNALIRNNKGRIDIKSKGTGKQGELKIFGTNNNHESSLIISEMIIKEYEAKNRSAYALIDKLVLYRNHSQAMFLVYELARNEVPINTSGAQLPHKDKIVRDLCDIVYLLRNPRSSYHASKHLHMVSTQLTKPKKMEECPFFNSGDKEPFMLIPVNVKRPEIYKAELEKLIEISYMLKDKKPASEVFSALLPMYFDAYYKRYNIDAMTGKTEEDVKAIVTFLIEDIPKDYDFDQFLYMINKVEQFIIKSNDDPYALKVFTVHSAKGLEAEKVYLLDCNGSVQPSRSTVNKLAEKGAVKALDEYITEERSIFYVAITRTLKDLIVTYNKNNPSPFNLESSLNSELKATRDVISIEKFGFNRDKIFNDKQMELINKAKENQFNLEKALGTADPLTGQTSSYNEERSVIGGVNSIFEMDFTLNKTEDKEKSDKLNIRF